MNIKRYELKDDGKYYHVTLQVDLDVLTVAKATKINSNWAGSEDRLTKSGGNVQSAVIRLFGEAVISWMQSEGGVYFGPATTVCSHWSDLCGRTWSSNVWCSGGWGGYGLQGEANEDYGWCGIRCIGADVSVPSFDELELVEVPHA